MTWAFIHDIGCTPQDLGLNLYENCYFHIIQSLDPRLYYPKTIAEFFVTLNKDGQIVLHLFEDADFEIGLSQAVCFLDHTLSLYDQDSKYSLFSFAESKHKVFCELTLELIETLRKEKQITLIFNQKTTLSYFTGLTIFFSDKSEPSLTDYLM